jgi:hypothetical protein
VPAHTKVFQVIEGRNIPDWKKFIYVKENKQASTKGQNPATKELGKLLFRTAALDMIYKISSLYHLHGTWTPR